MSATLPDKFGEQNWTEDYVDDDNGCYMHLCSDCGRVFLGHKRHPRQCRICAIPKATREQLADLRAQLQAANERAEVLTIYEQRLDEARRERDIAEQTNAALKAEVERLKGALELGQENCDAEYNRLRDERDEMTRIAQDASKGELAAIQRESAFKAAAARLAGALKYNDAILQTIQVNAGDGNLVDIVSARTGNAVALSAYAKAKEAQP